MLSIQRFPISLVALTWLIGMGASSAFSQDAARIQQATNRAVAFLKAEVPKRPSSGEAVLGALAIVKAGESPDEASVQAVLREIEKRCEGEKYKPHGHHYYVAGLEIMLLEAVDPAHYYDQMNKILAYILAGQLSSGSWYYPNQNGTGDTSIVQYAALGMWSAERAGLNVPPAAWDRMAAWHLKTQLPNGAFRYHPAEPEHQAPGPAVTLGGGANLLLARLYLHGDIAKSRSADEAKAKQEAAAKRFGVLEKVDLDEREGTAGGKKADDKEVNTTAGGIDQSVARAQNWSAVNFTLPPPGQFKMYYLYALERLAALGDIKALGPHNWYALGAQMLITQQLDTGTWNIDGGDPIASAGFGVLFLSRSTARMLGRSQAGPGLGGGILAGGRGMPENLESARVRDGKIEGGEPASSLEELLARLETADVGEIGGAQQEILESVRFGDREKLLAERDRIRRLVGHPRLEVRRTAFWVLGRAGDLSDVPRLIQGLSDQEVDVAIEAHNGLCVLSRRPLGFGVPPDPLAGLKEDASEKERADALGQWQTAAIDAWRKWYEQVAPYEERDGLGLFFDPKSPRSGGLAP